MKISFTLLALLVAVSSIAQDLTGTWEGVYSSNNFYAGRRSWFMYMELKQDGRKLEGVFYISVVPKKIDVISTVSGELGKKKLFPFRLVRGSILVGQGFSTGLNQFENIRYLKNDSTQVLYGQLLNDALSGLNAGAGFAVKKIDNSYPLIEKYNKKN